MRNRSIIVMTFISLAVVGFCLNSWSIARSQKVDVQQGQQRPLAPQRPVAAQRNILEAQEKPKVPINGDFRPISSLQLTATSADVNNSMKARRDMAWKIVESVWTPIHVQGGKVPTWMTWYEQDDVEQLYKEMLSQQRNLSPAEITARVSALMQRHSVKDLQATLTATRLGKRLRQFTFPQAPALPPNTNPSVGNIYYSPAYVQHLLENAANIARCDPNAFQTHSLAIPMTSRQQRQQSRIERTTTVREAEGSLASVPANLRPADPNNLYALCMDHEMPPDAVMIKATWSPVTIEPDRNQASQRVEVLKGVHIFLSKPLGSDGSEDKMAAKLLVPPSGQWIKSPYNSDEGGYGGLYALLSFGFGLTDRLFAVKDEKGQKWVLLGMHIASKNLRTWMWTSLFVGPDDWNWNADAPTHLQSEWQSPFENFGMCTVSDFNEGDAKPWAAYDNGDERRRSLGNSIKAVAHVMNGAQWCANPYIETNMSHGNCIGCHQGSTESFMPGVVARRQQFNISDFSFSFATNRQAFIDAAHQRRQ